MRQLVLLLLVSAVAPGSVLAQDGAGLRVGAVVTAPGRVLNAGPGRVALGLGFGLEGAWVHRTAGGLTLAYVGRIVTAAVEGKQAGNTWEPGRAVLLDIAARVESNVGPDATLFVGPGISHWSGPDDTAPFADIGGALVGAEAGIAWRVGPPGWRVALTSRMTRIGPDESREMQSGFTFRWLLGVERAR